MPPGAVARESRATPSRPRRRRVAVACWPPWLRAVALQFSMKVPADRFSAAGRRRSAIVCTAGRRAWRWECLDARRAPDLPPAAVVITSSRCQEASVVAHFVTPRRRRDRSLGGVAGTVGNDRRRAPTSASCRKRRAPLCQIGRKAVWRRSYLVGVTRRGCGSAWLGAGPRVALSSFARVRRCSASPPVTRRPRRLTDTVPRGRAVEPCCRRGLTPGGRAPAGVSAVTSPCCGRRLVCRRCASVRGVVVLPRV
jgi:hypothetical protein